MLSNGQNKEHYSILLQSTFGKGKTSGCCSWIPDQTQDISSPYLLTNKLNVKSIVVILPQPPHPQTIWWGGLNAISGDPDTVTIKHIAVYFHIHTFQVKM